MKFGEYKEEMINGMTNEQTIDLMTDYIELLESQMEDADALITEYAIDTGDASLMNESDDTMEDEDSSLSEAFIKKVRFNRSKRRTRAKKYKRNRAKIKMQQKKYRRTPAFKKAKRKRSKSNYKHRRYV